MAEKKIIEVGADVSDALKEIKNLFNTMVEEEKKAQKQTAETTEAVKGIGKASKSTEKGVKSISKGFKGMGLAMKAAGIGLIISAFQGLKDIMSQNQRVVDIFSTAFETASIVINQVVDALFNTYDAISKNTENFDALKNVMKSLLTVAITPTKLSFYAIKLAVQEAQLAWENSFFGDKDPDTLKNLNLAIKETKDTIFETVQEAIDSSKNIGEAIDEIKNMANIATENLSKVSIKAAYEQAQLNVELKNSAEIAAAQQSRLVEQYDRQAEKLRQVRDEERNSIEVRKKANDELLKVLDDQEKAMLKQADLQIASAQNEKDKNNTIEAQVALIDALANREGVLAQIEGLRSEQKVNDLGLDKEQIELTNSKLESESKLSIERQRFNAEQIEDELLKLERLKEIDELEAQQETERLQVIVDNANAETQAKIDAQIALDEFIEQSRQQNITRDAEIANERKNIRIQDLESEKAIVDAKKMLQYDLVNATSGAVGAIGNLFAKSTAASKTAALAEIAIETGLGFVNGLSIAQKSAKATGPAAAFAFPIFYATQIAAVLSSVNKASGILSKVKGGGSGSRASAPNIPRSAGGAAAPQAQAPQFNIVGQSSTDQLAGAIGAQNNQPIKAYVVSDDVTTAQQMDRSIIQGATI